MDASNLNSRLSIRKAGETFELMPERVVHWPRRRTLLAADLHWGKSETFRAAGIPIPDALVDSDLERLGKALRDTGAEKIVVLGDLVHGGRGLVPGLVDKIRRWREAHPVSFTVIRGNHERGVAPFPREWRIEEAEGAIRDGSVWLTHDPDELDALPRGTVCLSGHLHPMLSVRGGGDALRLPCFVVDEDAIVLPAFSEFTGGVNIRPRLGRRLFAVAEDFLMEF